MNLLIVFHDLWGMHVDGMTDQERKDYGVLHDNLYEFAITIQRPAEKNEDNTWKGNECLHCFCRTAAEPISDDRDTRDKSLWMWLLHLAAAAGYGKYHSTLLQVMTEGKGREYCNNLLDVQHMKRQASMSMAWSRIQIMLRRNSRVGALIRPAIHNKVKA
jgi:hypothetical protein